jgi:hypothetical protein
MPTNPKTELQTQRREIFGGLASAWAALSDTQRASWLGCAKKFPKVDSLGQTVVLSAFQQFLRSNTVLNMIGVGSQLEPKADTLFSNAPIVPSINAGATPKFEFEYQPPNVGQYLLVDCSPMVRPGVSYFADWRNLAIQGSGSVSPADELAKYVLRYGTLQAGTRIFLRSRVLNECGVFGPEFVTSTIVEPGSVIPLSKHPDAPKGTRKNKEDK